MEYKFTLEDIDLIAVLSFYDGEKGICGKAPEDCRPEVDPKMEIEGIYFRDINIEVKSELRELAEKYIYTHKAEILKELNEKEY